MPSRPQILATPDRYPIAGHRRLDDIAAYRDGKPVSLARFLGDVARVAGAMPESGHVLNVCADRYRFAVALAAALVRGQTTLLPPATTPALVSAMRDLYPDAYYVAEKREPEIDLPFVRLPPDDHDAVDATIVPTIAASQVAVIVFTSGSTGAPQPHAKRWGALVLDLHAEATRLAIGGPGHTILGTVPPQHMYGLESTVLLPLLSGAALTAERPYFPADIDAAIRARPASRTLFTTPFHLRNWLDAGDPAQVECIVSATAPLSATLAAEVEARTGATLFEIYGCTETGQIATRRPTRSIDWQTCGDVRLHEENGRAWASGGHVDTPTALMDDIDIAADGRHFRLLGRMADLVNIAGKRNSLGYLDHQLLAIPGVVDGVFYMPEDERPDGITRLMAFAVAPGLTVTRILDALRACLDPVFLPRPLVLVESLPRSATGKLPREALRELALRHGAAIATKGR